MTYAIETKKRKFERILESLTDSSAAQTRTSLNTRNNVSPTPLATRQNTDLSKRRRITPTSAVQQLAKTSTASLTTHYLPSSRLAFLERLESFRQVTKWHIPSTSSINAAEWAKRGWICQDTDTVSCSNCKERLHVDIDVEGYVTESDTQIPNKDDETEDNDSLMTPNDVLQALIRRYQDMIITAHTDVCPWRRRGCDNSIQRIEGLLNMPTALSSLDERYQSMIREPMDVPDVVPLSSSELCTINEQEIKTLQLANEHSDKGHNAMRLAICGWQKKEEDIIECRHCFRSLGLWLYRGVEPTMEHLDAVDSHLEYCPWRSEVAQDSELSLTVDKGDSRKRKMPGWILVYLAIVKKNNRNRTPGSRDSSQRHLDHNDDEITPPQLTPEQREKKMKDLMKRIRDLKRPFNVKSLLKRKDKPQQ